MHQKNIRFKVLRIENVAEKKITDDMFTIDSNERSEQN